jgi:hypothetical protein
MAMLFIGGRVYFFLIFFLHYVHPRFLLSEHKPSGFLQVRVISNSILMGPLEEIQETLDMA